MFFSFFIAKLVKLLQCKVERRSNGGTGHRDRESFIQTFETLFSDNLPERTSEASIFWYDVLLVGLAIVALIMSMNTLESDFDQLEGMRERSRYASTGEGSSADFEGEKFVMLFILLHL